MNTFKTLSIILIALFGTFCYSQSAKEMLAQIEGKWKFDENGKVLFTRTIELPGQNKKELFDRISEYYRTHYGNAREMVQTSDFENGIFIRKGIFKDAHVGYSVLKAHVDAAHILTIKVTDNTVELNLILTEYAEKIEQYAYVDDDAPQKIYRSKVEENYPVNPDGRQKTIMTKAFYKSYKAAMLSMDAIEGALKK